MSLGGRGSFFRVKINVIMGTRREMGGGRWKRIVELIMSFEHDDKVEKGELEISISHSRER